MTGDDISNKELLREFSNQISELRKDSKVTQTQVTELTVTLKDHIQQADLRDRQIEALGVRIKALENIRVGNEAVTATVNKWLRITTAIIGSGVLTYIIDVIVHHV